MSWELLLTSNRQVRLYTERFGKNPWARSPFYWLKRLANGPRGQAALSTIDTMLVSLGYKVTAGPMTQSLVINRRVVKLKLSMAWSGQKNFVFQQIEDVPYTHLAMLGIEPINAWFWMCPKSVAYDYSTSQHGFDSRQIRFSIDHLPAWLDEYGGDISVFEETCLRRLGSPK
jgi:hypothetical protein